MKCSLYHIDRKLLQWITKTNWQEQPECFVVYLAAATNEDSVKEMK